MRIPTYLVLAAVVLVIFVLAALFAPSENAGLRDAAAALALITGVSVGIERILEGCWSLVDLSGKAGWPFSPIHDALDGFERQITADMQGLLSVGELRKQELMKADQQDMEQIARLQQGLDTVKGAMAAAARLAPGSERIRFLTTTGSQAVKGLEGLTSEATLVAMKLQGAGTALDGLLQSFKDNPGRRVISLYAGIVLGLAAGLVLGLDMFQATLNIVPGRGSAFPHIGVALTGVVMGLGSSPAHEIIGALQQLKTRGKTP